MAATKLLSDNGVTSGITGYQLTGGNDGTLQLQTTTAGGTATTAMTIDTSQNVGIGTSSPTSYGAGTTTLSVSNSSGSGYFDLYNAGARRGYHYATSTTYNVSTTSATSLVFETAGSERMRIDSSGNVGIGVTGPTSTGLSLAGSKNLTWQYNGAGTDYANIFNQDNSASLILASGYKYAATPGGFASSFAGSWAKSAISVGYGGIYLYADTATTVAIGTNVTPTAKVRILSTGEYTKYDATTNTYIRDFGCYSAANTYLHIKFNTKYDSNKMIGWRLYGYQAYNVFIDTYYGCYLYAVQPSSPYGSIVRDAGSASGGAMYYSADGYLCISCQVNANNYTGLRLESLVNGGDYGGGIDVAVLAYKGYATATGAY